MRILIFGAGVLGCNLARNLFRAGKDVTLLARGNWAKEIQANGLRIKNLLSPRTSICRIPVITELSPEDTYDVVFAAVSLATVWKTNRFRHFRTPCRKIRILRLAAQKIISNTARR